MPAYLAMSPLSSMTSETHTFFNTVIENQRYDIKKIAPSWRQTKNFAVVACSSVHHSIHVSKSIFHQENILSKIPQAEHTLRATAIRIWLVQSVYAASKSIPAFSSERMLSHLSSIQATVIIATPNIPKQIYITFRSH